MNFENLPPSMIGALKKLDGYLQSTEASLRILLGGASALKIRGLILRASLDLDSFTSLSDEVRSKISAIAMENDLDEDWLNDRASNIPLPDGAESSAEMLHSGLKRIIIEVISRKNLMILKTSAAVIRGEERDISDLREAGITREEFEAAIDYICKYQGPDDGQFRQYQLDDIEVLRGWLFK